MADAPICEYCRESIEPPDEPVRMAKQVEANAFNPAGQRQWIDGQISTFHESHAPPSQIGRWRRVTTNATETKPMTDPVQRLEKQRLSLYLAASDMDQTAAAAEALDAENDDVFLMRALETAIATCYGRPFTKGSMVVRLNAGKWVSPGRDRELHEALMQMRHRVYSHTDEASGRSAGSTEATTKNGVLTVGYSEGWWAFPTEWIPEVIDLCRRQAKHFRVEALKIEARIALPTFKATRPPP